MADWKIREAQPEDCHQLLNLIKEMADFEKLSHMVSMTEEQLKDDAFGADPCLKALVVEATKTDGTENDKTLIGYAVYFFSYSTFAGRSLYLEDIYVNGDFRSRGIGSALWKKVAQIGVKKGCTRLDFLALSWNSKAIQFYEGRGAVNITTRDKWNVFRLEGEALKSFSS